jgi:hypothetical protein
LNKHRVQWSSRKKSRESARARERERDRQSKRERETDRARERDRQSKRERERERERDHVFKSLTTYRVMVVGDGVLQIVVGSFGFAQL